VAKNRVPRLPVRVLAQVDRDVNPRIQLPEISRISVLTDSRSAAVNQRQAALSAGKSEN
jgi:hypothetical protein